MFHIRTICPNFFFGCRDFAEIWCVIGVHRGDKGNFLHRVVFMRHRRFLWLTHELRRLSILANLAGSLKPRSAENIAEHQIVTSEAIVNIHTRDR